eukprot:TRINITY_DN505_c0_g1_i2.p1 TRINITY_DN505_c0_g1~~TRINITY_DN505_c0_g1_i2.p1  ORF type:complete len:348 (-),score=86.44 TRINITY_DN505_c0_g1_i2:44-1087(-)
MSNLSENEVLTWLTNSVQLPQYTSIFKENNIDGQVLVELTDDDLKGMGISSLGHRKKIITMAKSAGSHSGPSHPASSHTGVSHPTSSHTGPSHPTSSHPSNTGHGSNPAHAQQRNVAPGPTKGAPAKGALAKGNPPKSAPHNDGAQGTPLFRLTLDGKGLQGGQIDEEVTFQIKALDPKENKPKDIDGKKLSINVDGPSVPKSTMSGSGSAYTVTYSVKKGGDYFIDILYEGKSVLPQPVKVHFSAPSDPHHCTINAPATAKANEKIFIKIYAKDSNGDPVKGGGEPFKINVNGPDPKSLSDLAIDNDGDDVYTLSCILHVPRSTYTFSISLNGQPVGNSPFSINCL